MKVSILCDSEQATQTISFKFEQVVSTKEKIEFNIFEWNKLKFIDNKLRYSSLFECSYLILSRWYRPSEYKRIIDLSRKRNKKVFLHLDDFLFKVPKAVGLEKWSHYNSKMMLDSLHETAVLVDGIICSTPRLSQAINDILPKLKTFTCPVYKVFTPPTRKIGANSQRPYPVIGYMGTSSHWEDLNLICPMIDQLMASNKLLVVETFGSEMPAILAAKYPNRCVTLDKVNNYAEFQASLSSRGWWLGLAPLVESTFNYCKANTKLLEYIQAGIPVLASDFGPYQDTPWAASSKPSVDGTDWTEKVEAILYSKSLRTNVYEQQFRYCQNLNAADSLVQFYGELH